MILIKTLSYFLDYLQAHVVAAFEQSLSNMTNRLQQLTCDADQKDSELQDLRNKIELLKYTQQAAGERNGQPLSVDSAALLRKQSFGKDSSACKYSLWTFLISWLIPCLLL